MIVTKKKYTKHNKYSTRSKSLNKVRSRQSGGDNKHLKPKYVKATYNGKMASVFEEALNGNLNEYGKLISAQTINFNKLKSIKTTDLKNEQYLTLPNIELLQIGEFRLDFYISYFNARENKQSEYRRVALINYTRTKGLFSKTSKPTEKDIHEYKTNFLEIINKYELKKYDTIILKICIHKKDSIHVRPLETLVFKISINDDILPEQDNEQVSKPISRRNTTPAFNRVYSLAHYNTTV